MCNVICGVPQNSILGPLLILIYVNHLHKASSIHKSQLQMMQTCSYLLKISTNYLVIRVLSYKKCQFGLRQMSSLNLTKTKWTLFHSKKKKRLVTNDLPILYIDNFEIVRERVTKFLGIFIDKNMTWKYHIKHVCNKVSKSIRIIYYIQVQKYCQ